VKNSDKLTLSPDDPGHRLPTALPPLHSEEELENFSKMVKTRKSI
jgi:hypothetical protein